MAPTTALALALAVLTLMIDGVLSTGSRSLLQPPVTTVTGKAMLIIQNYGGKASATTLAVQTASGKLVQVDHDPSHLKGLHTGMDVKVKGRWQHPHAAAAAGTNAATAAGTASLPSFKAASIQAAGGTAVGTASSGAITRASRQLIESASSSMNIIAPVTSEIKALFIPIKAVSDGAACPGTTLPEQTLGDIRKAMFAEANPSGPSAGGTFDLCSHGKTKLPAAGSNVTDFVELPCYGSTAGYIYGWTGCSPDDWMGWAETAEAVLRDQGVPVDSYKHRVYLLPPNSCSFAGASFIGCAANPGSVCRTWITNSAWTEPNTIVHELGHTLGMGHAGSFDADGDFNKYIDDSAAMGECCINRCHNTPHSWQMGWVSVQQLDASTMPPGSTVVASMPSQAVSSRTGLRIVPGWVKGVDPIFVGFRTREHGDAWMAADFHRKLLVYTSPIKGSQDDETTAHMATLAAGETYEHTAAGVVVRFKAVSRGSAVVTVCRKGGAETAASCAAGLDNDCNGLVGAADPACTGHLQAA